MSAIKLHLEMAEADALKRFAENLQVSPEDILYCALNRLMTGARDPSIRKDIIYTKHWRRENLPLWSDSAASIHAYECKECDEPAPSRYL